jgi:hypothetical protein
MQRHGNVMQYFFTATQNRNKKMLSQNPASISLSKEAGKSENQVAISGLK